MPALGARRIVRRSPLASPSRSRLPSRRSGVRDGVEERGSFGSVGARGEDLLELIDGEHKALRFPLLAHRTSHRVEDGRPGGSPRRPTDRCPGWHPTRVRAEAPHAAGRTCCSPRRRRRRGTFPRRDDRPPRTTCSRPKKNSASTPRIVRVPCMGTHPLHAQAQRVPASLVPAWGPGQGSPLEPLQSEARLDPELTDQHLAGAREALERLGLAPGSVQGKHQLTPAPFAQRLLSNHGPRSATS